MVHQKKCGIDDLTSSVAMRGIRKNPAIRSQGRHPTRTSKNQLFTKEIVADPSALKLQIWYR
jgi:hypothetical protein